jgi:hypothetical protein
MKNTMRIILSAIIGLFLINFIAWSSGNENFYTHKVKEDVSPLDIKEPDVDRNYFMETVIVETVIPSSTPMVFESKFDTLSTSLKSSSK